ncbi:MAG: helix-turn-helix domain-containing protein [Oscillospiraceae bacterium]|nr:helix-turn-helix domain-containing protein [Oscillospiraceae bacterium]
MTLGEKLRQLRRGLGMTQKELAGERITRNMLSQIESGTATPSMKTLQYLAERLGVSAASLMDPADGASTLDAARRRLRAGDLEQAIALAEKVSGASEERRVLLAHAKFRLSQARLLQGRVCEAEELARAALRDNEKSLYPSESMQFKLLTTIAACEVHRGGNPVESLNAAKESYREAGWESLYHILLARDLMRRDRLQAAERELWQVTVLPDRELSLFWITRGEIALRQDKLSDALACLKRAEETDIPGTSLSRELYKHLETIYRETEDYQNAYFYAAKLREMDKTTDDRSETVPQASLEKAP